MLQNFQINSEEIDKIKKITSEEKNFRIKNLKFFQNSGFPNKRQEDWKFSDFQNIVNNNFDELKVENITSNIHKIKTLEDFDHNFIFLINGNLHSSNFDYEEKNKIKIKKYKCNTDYLPSKNPLICLNHALADGGYSLEIEENYKFKKVLVIYNFFTNNIKNKILNNKNEIKLKKNSELHIIEYTINESKDKFINNTYENIILKENSKLKTIYLQNGKSNGYFYRFLKNSLSFNSNNVSFIFSSGLNFYKMDLEFNLLDEKCRCELLSALFLNNNEHNEIKTRVNHLAPNCTSYQKVKNVLNSESKGIFQGKIHVKDVAQKTDAYQLSKALLLTDNAEFNSKPELEIYADDVKCSHGSTSGSLDEDSLHYLMTRGLNRKESAKLLIRGFLNEVVEFIKNPKIKKFVLKKLEEQIHEY